jgi:hypothetical protein
MLLTTFLVFFQNRICVSSFCTYHYSGIADPEESAFAMSIALQAFFEGRQITRQDMDKCIAYWRENVSEKYSMVERKRDICMEPICIPCLDGSNAYRCFHIRRENPYTDERDKTLELEEVGTVIINSRVSYELQFPSVLFGQGRRLSLTVRFVFFG